MTEEEKRQAIEQEIRNLTADLTSSVSDCGDWKVAKYQEYVLAGLEPPYNIKEVHAVREAKRERIRELQKML